MKEGSREVEGEDGGENGIEEVVEVESEVSRLPPTLLPVRVGSRYDGEGKSFVFSLKRQKMWGQRA